MTTKHSPGHAALAAEPNPLPSLAPHLDDRTAPDAPPERLTDRACLLYTDVPELPHEELADLVEAFVTDEAPRPAEASAAVVALALSCIPDRASFLDGDWIPTGLAQVRSHYTGGGFGDRRTLALLERVLDWMRARGTLTSDEHARLLAKADLARAAVGLAPKRPPVWIEPSYPHGIDEIAAAFLRDAELSPLSRRLARSALDVLESALQRDRGPVIFGRLAPATLPVFFAGETEEEREVDRHMAALWGQFYRWLGDTGRMDAARARAIARELVRYALAPAPFET
jgi:GNAT superfamily N-acetyltransferase